MRQDEGVVRVLWTRAELIALREAVEITPNFEGRQDVRDILRVAVRAPRMTELALDAELAEKLSGRIVPIDLAQRDQLSPRPEDAHDPLVLLPHAPKCTNVLRSSYPPRGEVAAGPSVSLCGGPRADRAG